MQRDTENGISPVLAIVFSLMMAVLTGTAVYYWQNTNKPSPQVTLQQARRINELEEQVEVLERRLNSLRNSETPSRRIENPVVVYRPGGLFSETERNSIKEKLVNPFFDFYDGDGLKYVVMIVTKNDPPVESYKYTVIAVTDTGAYSDFLYGREEPLEWWKPQCLGDCAFSDEYREKYPEVVD